MLQVATVFATATLPLLLAMAGILAIFTMGFMASARYVEGYGPWEQLMVKDNPALWIRFGAFLFAATISFFGVVTPTGLGLEQDLNMITKYLLVIMVGLFVSLKVNDYLILPTFDNNAEVVREKNVAVAIVEGSTYIATGLNFSGALHGALQGMGGGFLVSLGWFCIGQVILIALSLLYRSVMRGMDDALNTHDYACALPLAGFLLSAGLALRTAVYGEFHGWLVELPNVGLFMAGWLLTMAAIYGVFCLVLGKTRFHQEILVDRNWGIGFTYGLLQVAFTFVYISKLG